MVPDEHDAERFVTTEHAYEPISQDELDIKTAKTDEPEMQSTTQEADNIEEITSHTLTKEDQDKLEDINYLITTYDIQNIRISHRKKSRFLSNNYIEKNNGF